VSKRHDGAAYDAKRDRWSNAILGVLDREFPGFAVNATSAGFNTAGTINKYLNAPKGAIYGSCLRLGPIWKGVEQSPRGGSLRATARAG
jgi:hypothetical protein